MPAPSKPGETGDKRGSITFPIAPEANAIIARWLALHGGGKTEMLRNIIAFFSIAPANLQYMLTQRVAEPSRLHDAHQLGKYFSGLDEDAVQALYAAADTARGQDTLPVTATPPIEEKPEQGKQQPVANVGAASHVEPPATGKQADIASTVITPTSTPPATGNKDKQDSLPIEKKKQHRKKRDTGS